MALDFGNCEIDCCQLCMMCTCKCVCVCMWVYIYDQAPISRDHVTRQSLKKAFKGSLARSISSSQMVAKESRGIPGTEGAAILSLQTNL